MEATREGGGKKGERGGGGWGEQRKGITLGSATAAPLMSCHVTACSLGRTPHGITPALQTAASLALTCLWPGLLNHTSSSETTCTKQQCAMSQHQQQATGCGTKHAGWKRALYIIQHLCLTLPSLSVCICMICANVVGAILETRKLDLTKHGLLRQLLLV